MQRSQWESFLESLDACKRLEHPWTLELSDPLSNSFIAPCTDDVADDKRLTMLDYTRSAEEDEELAIDHLQQMEMVD